MNEHKKCFGKILPDIDRVRANRTERGVAFRATIHSSGMGVQKRDVEGDLEAWDACRECSEFASCYEFSIASLLLKQSLNQRF